MFILPSILTTKVYSSQLEDFFYSNGQTYDVSVSLDSVGVFVRNGLTEKHITVFSDDYGMTLTDKYPVNIYVFDLETQKTRSELVALTREITERGIADYAGLVVNLIGDDYPIILTDEFIVKFKDSASTAQIDAYNSANGVMKVKDNPYRPKQPRLKVTGASGIDALEMSNRYHEDNLTEFAHPNFISIIEPQQFTPNDAYFDNQWHHRNTGQNGGTVDADIDTDLAWEITMGDPDVIIAVCDFGIDMDHPDLTPNMWVNPGEIAANGLDDDGNGYIDDINGWNFSDGSNLPDEPYIDDEIFPHGTAVTGLAAARGNNMLGVTGSAPYCTFMPVVPGATDDDKASAFDYMRENGADIISNSWNYLPSVLPTIVSNAISDATSAGIVVLFAAGNFDRDVCSGNDAISTASRSDVITVSSCSNWDRKVINAGYGNCVDILAPSNRGSGITDPFVGTLNIATTDTTGPDGYNDSWESTSDLTGLVENPDNNYTNLFGGTSAATPITAGVAGLLLSANDDLTRIEVQRLIQDTADKIEPGVADYDGFTGYSSPSTGIATHAWGRLNAFEAVHIAAPADEGGKEGVDVFFRDNHLDWGNTEQPSYTVFEQQREFIPFWRSMDIKIDAPPYETAPTAQTFDAFFDETPSGTTGDVNRIYVRVRNRGPNTALHVIVKLLWAQFGTALPPLPADYWDIWPVNSTDTTQWHPLNVTGTSSPIAMLFDLEYSGSSIANTTDDAAQIVSFDFPTPEIDPAISDHYCFLAMTDNIKDRIAPKADPDFPTPLVVDKITPFDNNVTHKNYYGFDTSSNDDFGAGFLARNPYGEPIDVELVLEAPANWIVNLDGLNFGETFTLQPLEEIPVRVEVDTGEKNASGDIDIIQRRVDVDPPEIMGGITLNFKGESEPERFRRFSASIHGGVTYPIGDLANNYGTGWCVIGDVEYHFTPSWSLVGLFGYNRFPSEIAAIDDEYIFNISANIKYNHALTPVISPYVCAGPGYYIPGTNDDSFGVNLGGGVDFPLKPWITIEAGANYHLLTENNLQFLQGYGGIIFRF